MGFNASVFIDKYANKNLWIPDANNIDCFFYERDRRFAYLISDLLSGFSDFLGLKKVFINSKSDFIHAHNLESAFYSFKLGLPTIFDDWEYYLEYFDYNPDPKPNPLSLPIRILRNRRAKRIVRDLIKNIPIIVTNKNVALKYESLDAKRVFVVPNVPLSLEREYAFKVNINKLPTLTTGYIGRMNRDNLSVLRNTRGIEDLWKKFSLGDLYIFEGNRYCPHLDVLRKLREFHFNLLYWKPLSVHKYYLQNKAFLASVVGVPTIISSSLTATIDLLGEYALTVDSIDDIPVIIANSKDYSTFMLNPKHLWGFYESEIREAYNFLI
ncbi:MAG: hypothetical protein AC479_08415 [miscellaneous Crenarchaeota group-6 archaeon AD8-1]|nr:MAG: hypothetical protein AC479_08415 [miscellaneous Crenarchaeota group-6 archaeon AD8-1]